MTSTGIPEEEGSAGKSMTKLIHIT